MTNTPTTSKIATDAALSSALRSAWITFTALASGFLAGAIAANATGSPSALLAYSRTAWFPFLVAQLVGPSLHAGWSYRTVTKAAAASQG